MINKIKNRIWLNLKNIPGWTTKRKILVIEADDYGSINMPSKYVYTKLIEAKLVTDGKGYMDSLETEDDLAEMFQVLTSFTDIHGNHASVTPFFNPANPDFDRIRKEGFQEYYYKNYGEIIQEYNIGNNIRSLWEEGIRLGFFKPQYHGREHVNVFFFMKLLQENNPVLRTAFDLKFCHPNLPEHNVLASLRRAFYFENTTQKDAIENSLVDGIGLFKNNFGYKPTVFCPSNGTFHDDFKLSLKKEGIDTIVESGVRYIPSVEGGMQVVRKYKIGDYDKYFKMLSYSRNVTFEPIRDGRENSINKALRETATAFRWGKPAIVATHRANYCGGIELQNREKGLEALKTFVSQVQKKWPEVEFINSDQLSKLMNKEREQ